MSFKWSKHQQEAIHSKGQNILVSAAAGSGKTAVLTERVIQKLKQGVDIKQLVILTFTNKAAQEMRSRIRQHIQQDERLHHVLADLEQAHIQTFDSYALYILKTYGHHLNISKRLNMLDQADANIVKSMTMDALFLKRYQDEDQAFLNFVDTHATKDDATLMDALLSMYDRLALNPDRHQLFEQLENTYFTKTHFKALFAQFKALIVTQLNTLHRAYFSLKNTISHSKLLTMLKDDFSSWPLCDESMSYDALRTMLHSIQFKRQPSVKNDDLFDQERDMVKPLRDVVKSLISDLKDDTKASEETHFNRFMALKSDVHVVVDLLKSFEANYQTYQLENEQFDFSTVAMTAYDLINSVDIVRTHLTNNIHEVMVDEYQDTNKLQEAFVGLITDDNVYMVGDVKQSIYRFRHADPNIFVQKYLSYKNAAKGTVIDLNENYRSREGVLNDINHVFEHTMDQKLGGIDYDQAQRLNYGNKTFDDHQDPSVSYGINMHTYEKDETETLSKHEVEFFKLAAIIKDKLNKKHLIKDGSKMRPMRYGDVTVLIDKKARFDLAAKIFAYEGIPLKVHQSDAFLYQTDMMALKQLLTLVVSLYDQTVFDGQFKHAFMSVTRSFLFAYDDDMIVRQFLKFPKTLTSWKDLLSRLNDDFSELHALLEYGVKEGRFQPLDVMIESMFDRLDYNRKVLSLFGTKDALYRKHYLLELSKKQSELGFNMKQFVMYFDRLFKAEQDIEVTSASDFSADQVNLMTMHKSKGLQFPVVMVAGLDTTFQKQTSNMVIDDDFGMIMKVDDEGLTPTFLETLYKHKENDATISEKLRLLYVALTRAVEEVHLVLEAPEEELKPQDLLPYLERAQFKSFRDVLNSVSGYFSQLSTPFDFQAFADKRNYDIEQTRQVLPENPKPKKTYQPFAVDKQTQKTVRFSGGVQTFLEADALTAIQYGNLLHDALEHIDFERVDESLAAIPLDEESKRYLKQFFDLDLLYQEPLLSVYKEFPFVVEKEDTFSQGFVDLVLETPTKMMVIDYKLKHIDNPAYDAQVTGYCDTLRTFQDKPVEGYLYSIIEGTIKQVV